MFVYKRRTNKHYIMQDLPETMPRQEPPLKTIYITYYNMQASGFPLFAKHHHARLIITKVMVISRGALWPCLEGATLSAHRQGNANIEMFVYSVFPRSKNTS